MQGNSNQVLIVEDDRAVRATMTDVLRTAGFAVSAVEDGVDAESALRRQHYDTVVLDLILPGQSGIALLKRLSESETAARPRIVAVSGGDESTQAASALNLARLLGADTVLYKPFAPEELVAAVRGEG